MKITNSQVKKILEKLVRPDLLGDVLLEKFPDVEIVIIRGYDNFSYEAYTRDAYFENAQAEKAMDKIKPNGSLPDSYHLVRGTVRELREGKIADMRTRQPLDGVDEHMAYFAIYRRLNKSLSAKR